MTRYVAVINTPGYLSEQDEPPVFQTPREAWSYLEEEYKETCDSFEVEPDAEALTGFTTRWNYDEAGTLYTSTPGSDSEWDLGKAWCVVERPTVTPEGYVELPDHKFDATDHCTACGQERDDETYRDYLEHWWRYEYEGPQYADDGGRIRHEPYDEELWQYLQDTCHGTPLTYRPKD